MNQERVERLEALLSRVQENRKRTRTPAGLGLSKPEVARTAPEAAKPVHSVHTQTAAGLMPPQQAPVAAAPAPAPAQPEAVRPAAPVAPFAPFAPFARAAPQPAAAASPLRSAAPPASKLQMPARPAPAAEPAPAPRAAASAVEPAPSRKAAQAGATPLEMAVAELEMGAGAKAREPAPAAPPAAPAAPLAPAISPDEAFEPLRIEPEPMREAARPIAQVVSRHSPQVDATFGAMLKRSLSLRPH